MFNRNLTLGEKKTSEIKILCLMLFLILFLVLVFFVKRREAYSFSLKELGDGGSVFDSLCFLVDNGEQALKVKTWRDISVNPAVCCVFFPSCAENKDIFVYFDLRKTLILKGPDGEEILLESGDLLPDLKMNTEYDMRMDGGYNEDFDYTTITFFRSSDTASAYIDTKSGNMDHLNEDKENRESGWISIINEEGQTEYSGKLQEIKGHGNSTWARAKKPYGFKLFKSADLFSMGSSKNWILLSNSMDLSMIRNSLIADLAKELNYPASPEMHYVDLYLNGEYNGLYALSTKTEIAKNRLNITDLDYENKALNIIPPSGAERVERTEADSSFKAGVKLSSTPEDISGGYLIEHDYGEKFRSEPSRFYTKSGDKYVLRSPVYASLNEVEYISGLFSELESRVEKGEDLSDLIDLRSFAKIYVLDEFTRNEGAGVTSAYYYKDRDDKDPLIYAGPVWDYDQSLGNTYFPVVNETETLNFCTDHIQSTMLFYKLYKNYPEFLREVKRYYREEFRPCIVRYRENAMDSYLDKVLSDNGMNGRRWGNDEKSITDSFDQAETFIDERLTFLDKVWIEEKPITFLHLTDGHRDLHAGVLKDAEIPEVLKAMKAV